MWKAPYQREYLSELLLCSEFTEIRGAHGPLNRIFDSERGFSLFPQIGPHSHRDARNNTSEIAYKMMILGAQARLDCNWS